MEFTNKVVLVTGASAGIGESTAILFSKYGARLSLVGRNEENLRKVADLCEKSKGIKPLVIVADLSTDEGVERTAAETLKHFGRLDVLVNNAGLGARTTIERTDMATFDRVFAVNVRGVYNLTRLLVPALIESRGNIVNVSSISGSMPSVGSLPYSMTKAALDHFTRCVALELAPKGVRVNSVNPGITVSRSLVPHVCPIMAADATGRSLLHSNQGVHAGVSRFRQLRLKVSDFVKRMTGYSDAQYESWLREAERGIPMGRVAVGDHVAKMIVYLASDDAALVTGGLMPVDGGLSLAGAGDSSIMKKQVK